MDRQKEAEILRKRNALLNQQLEELKTQIAYDELFETEGYDRAKELVVELEKLRDAWELALKDLRDRQDECDKVLATVRELYSNMYDVKSILDGIAEAGNIPRGTLRHIRKDKKAMLKEKKSET